MSNFFPPILALLVAVCGVTSAVNSCLDPNTGRCTFESSHELDLASCGITDDDTGDVEACLESFGKNNIHSLYLWGNDLTTLPAGIFDSLPALTDLALAGNDLTTLPAGIFDSVPALQRLALGGNDLTTLPAGIFDSVPALADLILRNNDLTTLPAGIFDSVPALQRLFLSGNTNLECLPTVPSSVTIDQVAEDFGTECRCDFGNLADPCSAQGEECTPGSVGYTCGPGSDDDEDVGTVMGDPHMQGLRGQKIDWHGVDNGWYSLIKDDDADLIINVRLTAPLPDEFPDRQLITSLAVLSEGHSLVIEVENPYTTDMDGCPKGVSPCLANGGLRVFVDDQEAFELLRFSRQVLVADGAISVSASNLPVECRQFGGDKIWARMYQEMLEGTRELVDAETLEQWILSSGLMAAPGWCAKYIAENDLADLQSTHAIFKIKTPTVTVRLNAGVNFQGDGEVDWDGRVLPDLEFWQMDVGMDGLDVENPALSGLLGETARPMYDGNGYKVMAGFEAFPGDVEDYRVSSALGVHFPLLDKKHKV